MGQRQIHDLLRERYAAHGDLWCGALGDPWPRRGRLDHVPEPVHVLCLCHAVSGCAGAAVFHHPNQGEVSGVSGRGAVRVRRDHDALPAEPAAGGGGAQLPGLLR